MASPTSFLQAEWRKLAIANYTVDPAILHSYLPQKTELDLWNGRCYVSLVGFMFLNTKMLGIGFPFHRNFEEVNLRFYVKHHDGSQWKRGVVFIKEIVPKPILAFIARKVYHEPYQAMHMWHTWNETEINREVAYGWGKKNLLNVTADRASAPIPEGSELEFITEHYWGYTRVSPTKTFEYEVTHPKWEHYPVHAHHIDVDFAHLYGSHFGFLQKQVPESVLLAEGSSITVENKKVLSN